MMHLRKIRNGLCAAWQSLPLTRQFLLISAVIFLTGMVVTGIWMASRIAASVTQNTAAATALYFESIIAPLVQSLAHQDELPADQQAELGRLVSDTALGRRVVSFKIWRQDGVVVFATDKSLIGKKFAPSHEFTNAWAGNVAADFDSLDEEENVGERSRGMPLLEIYAPIREHGSDRVIAVAEFYERAGQLQRDISNATLEGWLIITAIALCAVLALFDLIGRAGRTIERQIAELRTLLAQNEELRARVELSSQRVSEVNERHLRRLGADLHDGPAQLLGLALLRLDAAAKANGAGKDSSKPPEDVETIRAALRDALQEIREISVGLALPALERLSLRDTLQAAVRDHTRRTNTAVEADIAAVQGDAAHPVKTAAFRFVQEALNNATRHAKAAAQRVTASQENGFLTIEIVDHGDGFDPDAASSESKLGLTGMRERLESIGGVFSITSIAGQGTRVTGRLPHNPA